MDKLVEEAARKLAMFMFDTYGDAEGVVWAGLDARQREKATKAAQAALAIAQKRVNELIAELRRRSIRKPVTEYGRGWNCGLEEAEDVIRAALPTMLKGNGDG